MIKRYLPFAIVILALAGVFLYLRKDHSPLVTTSEAPKKDLFRVPPQSHVPHQIDAEKLAIDGKKVVGLPLGNEKEAIKTVRVANRPSPLWEENLLSVLKTQAGDKLKSVSLKKVDSFVWVNDGLALFVESVIVTSRNIQNEESSFRALVDAQNGKILQTWDKPVIDSYRRTDDSYLQVDSRYHD